MIYSLDFNEMTDRDTAHDYLRSQLPLPDWYGNNLDALYDCVTEWQDVELLLLHTQSVDGYSKQILHVLTDAAEENPSVVLTIAE